MIKSSWEKLAGRMLRAANLRAHRKGWHHFRPFPPRVSRRGERNPDLRSFDYKIKRRVLVEVDGDYWHDRKTWWDSRKARDAVALGWRVVRFRVYDKPRGAPLGAFRVQFAAFLHAYQTGTLPARVEYDCRPAAPYKVGKRHVRYGPGEPPEPEKRATYRAYGPFF